MRKKQISVLETLRNYGLPGIYFKGQGSMQGTSIRKHLHSQNTRNLMTKTKKGKNLTLRLGELLVENSLFNNLYTKVVNFF